MEKQTLYFAVYINVGGMVPQKARETINAFINKYKTQTPFEDQYIEKFLYMPIKDGQSRIELLYPTPFLTSERTTELFQKYYEKYQDIIKQIDEL